MSDNVYEQYNIDKTKLQRDYINNPLIRSKSKYKNEDINPNDFYYLFVELNLSAQDLQEIFGWSRDTIYTWSKKFGMKKTKTKILEHMKKTNKEKYGTEYSWQNDDIKQKIKQTCLEKYGEGFYFDKEKSKRTCLKKYGVEYYTQTQEYKENEKHRRNGLSDEYKKKYKLKQRLLSMNDSEKAYILSDKELFIQTIQEHHLHNTQELCKYFGINQSNVNRLLREYDVRYLMDKTFSSPELDLLCHLSDKHQISMNNRQIIKPQEIDIFIPELNLGIEFNGSYWHNEYNKDVKYHQEKSMIAESKGIFIYHIFEYEWNYKREQILNQLNNLLGINQEKIYARKCVIKEVDNQEKSEFLEANHLQGNDSSSIKLGLYFQDELVSLMTFVKPRFTKKYEWELSRFCSKADCNVIGGASKLFKYFMNNYQPKSIISYSNIAHTKGNLYEMLGFDLKGISSPNYVWQRGNHILSRYQCQKHKLLEQGFEGNSETEIMHNRGYAKVYDCGNKIWGWYNQ